MKTTTLILLVIAMLGCNSFIRPNDEREFIVTKTGYVQLSSNEVLFFKCALVQVDNSTVRISNDKLNYELKWGNIRNISIYNECLQQEYIENLKKIRDYADKLEKRQGNTK